MGILLTTFQSFITYIWNCYYALWTADWLPFFVILCQDLQMNDNMLLPHLDNLQRHKTIFFNHQKDVWLRWNFPVTQWQSEGFWWHHAAANSICLGKLLIFRCGSVMNSWRCCWSPKPCNHNLWQTKTNQWAYMFTPNLMRFKVLCPTQ